jgi:hypothetical protein
MGPVRNGTARTTSTRSKKLPGGANSINIDVIIPVGAVNPNTDIRDVNTGALEVLRIE